MPQAPTIHPTAHVGKEADLAPGVVIGPFCVITGPVTLGAGVRLMGSNYVQGPTTIGAGTTLYPHACVGFEPQDVKFKPGDPTAGVVIGANCILREHATVNAAGKPDNPTRLGDSVFMLIGSHVGHDAVVGNNVTLINNAAVGGHARVGANVLMGGGAAVHQFCRIGRFAMVAGLAGVSQDLPPFCVCNSTNRMGGINRIGLRRNGFSREDITAITRAYMDILRTPTHREAMLSELRTRAKTLGCAPLLEMADFIQETNRGIMPGMGKPPRDAVAWFKKVQQIVASNQPPLDADDDDVD